MPISGCGQPEGVHSFELGQMAVLVDHEGEVQQRQFGSRKAEPTTTDCPTIETGCHELQQQRKDRNQDGQGVPDPEEPLLKSQVSLNDFTQLPSLKQSPISIGDLPLKPVTEYPFQFVFKHREAS
jgi:hypothetical protein